ncbi:hypothetical protein Rs2_20454 [Raphanus sativus]|uniref:Uncharacterized protein LOC108862826 n=1 Tax=Raphanus sativus TaxID=3726 RepID=A0A6J0P938_RAPSA|nr:uncharacterized protein LOC108862826 [Raphanus sativus]KAJ4893660.1 hypothetical protein Rs2_20454 [Raphanus sativus]
MSVLQSHQCLFSFSPPHPLRTTRLTSLYRPPESLSPFPSLSAFTRTRPDRIRVSAVEENADAPEEVEEDGPVELPPSATSPFSSTNSIFATSDDPSPLQLATSVMLTGAITIFLFRSIRRRAKRSKEMTFRSSGVTKSLKDEAMEKLKAMGSAPIEEAGGKSTTPSAAQAFLGAVSAGVIAVILYKFTTTIEAGLNRQTFSDNFSVRQITVTVRTIINGICYLATFVFGINAVGLLLYSGQLAFNEESDEAMQKATTEPGDSSGNNNNSEVNKSSEDQSSGD